MSNQKRYRLSLDGEQLSLVHDAVYQQVHYGYYADDESEIRDRQVLKGVEYRIQKLVDKDNRFLEETFRDE